MEVQERDCKKKRRKLKGEKGRCSEGRIDEVHQSFGSLAGEIWERGEE